MDLHVAVGNSARVKLEEVKEIRSKAGRFGGREHESNKAYGLNSKLEYKRGMGNRGVWSLAMPNFTHVER